MPFKIFPRLRAVAIGPLFRFLSLSPVLFLTIALSLHPAPATASSPYHSATCLAAGRFCTTFFAERSGACRARTPASGQPALCASSACRWCAFRGRKKVSAVCDNGTLVSRCGHKRASARAPRARQGRVVAAAGAGGAARGGGGGVGSDAGKTQLPKSPPGSAAPADRGGRQPVRPAGSCTWQGYAQVVINLGDVTARPKAGWERISRDGFSGLIFRPEWGLGLSWPRDGGTMCFPIRVKRSGDYFLTFVSYAPHRTEHNDAWISVSLPLQLWRTNGEGVRSEPAGKFLKAYQGNGPERGMSIEMKNGDHGGHRFVVPGVTAGRAFRVCMSGRSFRFSVFRIVLKRCFGKLCEGGNLWKSLVYGMPVSRCV